MHRILLPFYTLHLLNDGFQASFLLLLPFIAKDLSFNLTEVGWLVTGLSIFSVICALPAGAAAARWGGKQTLIILLILYAAGFFGVGVAPSFWYLLPAFIVAGVGYGAFHPVAFALLARLAAPSERGRVMGNFTAIGDVGRVALASIITFLIAWWGWRNTSLAYGGVALGVFTFLAYRLFKANGTRAPLPAVVHLPFQRLLRQPLFVLATLAGALDCFIVAFSPRRAHFFAV
jgi:predicted MFS family arabinose efflux permease